MLVLSQIPLLLPLKDLCLLSAFRATSSTISELTSGSLSCIVLEYLFDTIAAVRETGARAARRRVARAAMECMTGRLLQVFLAK